ncbi:hypothetical protein ASF22_21545 [Methylobacterium sp. Leaf87]|uniref:ShlB/FhaC/HecB family hemolysin secretion/activation protein n=1 Tax=Methylobacterium sp. Leaf87 TaxID=1736243 RepID=UPI0006FDD46E|nr:ShlB/FhaC/HecB family hemolysin secretion/activation protein [Methylobacterium sp. Leaf87]KQO64196.1 hypothetical protein ASF22_21545 [Methylobacterium sp. Leaf87]
MRHFSRTAVIVGAVAPVFATLQAAAQQLPPQIDAGTILRQNQRNERTLDDATRRLEGGVALPARPKNTVIAPGGATFTLKSIVFTPSEFLSKAELDALAAPLLGRPIDLSEVQALVNTINDRYTELGHITASATIPPQTLEGGAFTIRLVEGRVGQVKVEDADRSLDYVRRRIVVEEGRVIDVPLLTDRIQTFNRTGETQLRLGLQPGAQFGLSDLTLSVIEPARNTLQLFGDNYGVQTVGRHQGGGLFQHFGLLGLDDRLRVYGVQAAGNGTENVSYSFAATPTGGRIGLSYTRSDIQVISGPFESLDIRGQSQNGAMTLTQPLYGDKNWLLLANIGGALSGSITKQDTVKITRNTTERANFGMTLSYFGETFSVSVTPTFSRAHSNLRVAERDVDFNLFSGFGSAFVQLPENFSLQATGAWQFSNAKLLAGDQLFQIGGPGSLRGYATSGFAAFGGYYTTTELHRSLSDLVPGLDLYGFIDHGSVYTPNPRQTILTSTGVGLSYTFDRRLSAEVAAGFPLTRVGARPQDYFVYGRVILYVY